MRLLHAAGAPKPWERSAWRGLRDSGYARLMTRALLWPDVPLRLEPRELPIWLRDGPAARTALRSLHNVTRTTHRLRR